MVPPVLSVGDPVSAFIIHVRLLGQAISNAEASLILQMRNIRAKLASGR